MRKLANLIHRPDEPDGVWMRIRFGGSLPTSFTGRASRPGSHATCVAQRGRCPGLGEPRAFGPGTAPSIPVAGLTRTTCVPLVRSPKPRQDVRRPPITVLFPFNNSLIRFLRDDDEGSMPLQA